MFAFTLTLLHSEKPKFAGGLAVLSAIGLIHPSALACKMLRESVGHPDKTLFNVMTIATLIRYNINSKLPGCVAQSVGHLTHKSAVLGSISSLATYFRFSFC